MIVAVIVCVVLPGIVPCRITSVCGRPAAGHRCRVIQPRAEAAFDVHTRTVAVEPQTTLQVAWLPAVDVSQSTVVTPRPWMQICWCRHFDEICLAGGQVSCPGTAQDTVEQQVPASHRCRPSATGEPKQTRPAPQG